MTNPNPASTGWRKIQDDLALIREPVLRNIANDAAIEAYLLGSQRAAEWPRAELHEMPATALSVEQQIRLGVLGYLVDGGMLDYDEDDPGEVARLLAPVADPLVAWVATGTVTPAPTPSEDNQ